MARARLPVKNLGTKLSLVSMTGFGKGIARDSHLTVEVEVRSVNHRFLDLSLKVPRGYQEFESLIRASVAEEVERGRVEVTVNRVSSTTATSFQFNDGLFNALTKRYYSLLPKGASKDPQIASKIVMEILSRKEVLSSGEDSVSVSKETPLLQKALAQALKDLQAMRLVEGERLGIEISNRLSELRRRAEQVRGETTRLNNSLRDRVLSRVKKLAPEVQVDEGRLAAEVVFLTDRADLTEEIVRLGSHLEQFEKSAAVPHQGRKLDFLVQEIGREINTIGSKAQDATIQGIVVDMKVDLEKIREQLQNIS